MHNTKIVVTLGPATDNLSIVRTLLEAGVDVFRLNASHGTLAEHALRIDYIRSAATALGAHCGILLDLQGLKLRLGKFAGGASLLETGAEFTITTKEVLGDRHKASTTYQGFANDVRPGDRILLDDGGIELRALETDGTSVRSRVISGGRITDNKGINLPGVQIAAPSFTEKDTADLEFGLKQGVDFIALSFVRDADAVVRLRSMLGEKHADIPIIAKIEKPEAWEHLDSILAASDGVMVARGDLAVEMALERVPFIQKTIIQRARREGKIVIVATQMLESMTHNPFPTRAEVNDVANAIYDGSDAVMLSGETAIGSYPAETVKTMARIAAETELRPEFFACQDLPLGDAPSIPEIVTAAAGRAAASGRATAMAVFAVSGSAARLMSRLRSRAPIFAFATSTVIARRLSLYYGIHPILVSAVQSSEGMVELVERELRERGHVKPGDGIAVVAGQPASPGGTNLLKLHRVGESQV